MTTDGPGWQGYGSSVNYSCNFSQFEIIQNMKLKNTADTLSTPFVSEETEAQRGCINRPEDARQWVLI